MGWMSLVAALLSFLGPYIQKWLAGCAQSRAERAAAKLPPVESYASESDARRALLTAMLDDIPKWQFIRRAAMMRSMSVLNKYDVTTKTVGTLAAVGDANDVAEIENVFMGLAND